MVTIPFIVLICAVGGYLALSLIGIIRIWLFEKIYLNRAGKMIASKIDKVIYPEQLTKNTELTIKQR